MWTLLIDQGNGPKKHAERAGPEQLKAIAKALNNLASDKSAITYVICDATGKPRYTSSNNTGWRMRWKQPTPTQQQAYAA